MVKITQDFSAPRHCQGSAQHLAFPPMECLGYLMIPRGPITSSCSRSQVSWAERGRTLFMELVSSTLLLTNLICNKLANILGQACYLLHTVLCGSEQNTSCTMFLCHFQFQSAHLFVLGFWFCLPVKSNSGQSDEFSEVAQFRLTICF